jgi:hypothetical protein
MHRLVRIEGLHNFKQYAPLTFVLYNGSKYITLEGEIASSNYILFRNHQDDVSKLFVGFGITDNTKIAYCKKQDPNCVDGIFPMHSSLAALKKTLLSFFDLNTDIEIPPMYKVGDKVRIKSKYDLNSDSTDYPCGFSGVMLEKGIDGKIYTISSIRTPKSLSIRTLRHYKEPYYYTLKENSYNWSAAMFEDKIEELKSDQKDSIKITSIKNLIVSFTDGDSIKLNSDTLYYQGFCDVIRKVDRSFPYSTYGDIFHSRITCSRRCHCVEPEVQEKSLKWVILDYLKYYFGTEECKKTIDPDFYKYLKEKPKQGIIEQIDYSQTKTQGNAYQFCKRRSTVCRGNVPEGRTVQGKRSKASVSSRSLAYRAVIGQ